MKTYVYAPASWAKWYWLQNLEASGLRPCDGYFVMGSAAGHQDQGFESTAWACGALRRHGEVIPGVGHFLSSRLGDDFSAWRRMATWARLIPWVEEFCKPASSAERWSFVLDAEPYWEGGQRYPTDADRARIEKAAKPVIDLLLKYRVRLLVMPGGPEYVLNRWLAEAGVDVTDLDEGTYRTPLGELADGVRDVLKRERQVASVQRKYIPGFYGAGLRCSAWTGLFMEMVWLIGETSQWFSKGFDPCWFFLRPRADGPRLFGTEEWYE